MADILSLALTLGSDSAGEFGIVVVELRFSPTEVSTNLQYGINVAVMKRDDNVLLITVHKGMTAMSVRSYPVNAAAALFVSGASEVVRPDGQTTLTARIKVAFTRPVAAGTDLVALATVVPEIAETSHQSNTVTFQ